ncbi:F0F1 ATP synthase subunit B [Alsobacter sp. SYSU M60028]|uniref:ATP synthase subunit b n=1 Tax=Alsobacter ponti TaxID=2962936 RepID=A0ABT1LDS7_9HYPH|nr:F0F1 ATP synthase subunit B [Alsobacter ponti]MCP8939253.1 F0F1 ATP synthase subunit B [Alsobacter ponti]
MAQTTTASTEHPAEAHGNFPPFDSHSFGNQLLWLALAFGALYVLMSKVALPRVAAILEERHNRVADDLAQAAKLKSETDAAIEAYEKALADAKAKAQAIAGETRDKLAAETDARRRALEADLHVKLAEAERQIVDGKTKAMGNVRGIAVDTALAIVERLVGKTPSADEVDAAVGRALPASQVQ